MGGSQGLFIYDTLKLIDLLHITWSPYTDTKGPVGNLCSRTSEKAMAPHSSILAWKIPWTEKPGGLQSRGCKKSDMTEQLTLEMIKVERIRDPCTPHLS